MLREDKIVCRSEILGNQAIQRSDTETSDVFNC